MHEKTHAGKVGGAVGAIGGAAIGVIFPPAGVAILADAVVGGVGLGLVSHFAGGLSRHDLKELGALFEDGQAAVICVAEDAVATDVNKALDHAARKAEAKLDDGDVAAALAEIEKGVDSAADKAATTCPEPDPCPRSSITTPAGLPTSMRCGGWWSEAARRQSPVGPQSPRRQACRSRTSVTTSPHRTRSSPQRCGRWWSRLRELEDLNLADCTPAKAVVASLLVIPMTDERRRQPRCG